MSNAINFVMTASIISRCDFGRHTVGIAGDGITFHILVRILYTHFRGKLFVRIIGNFFAHAGKS